MSTNAFLQHIDWEGFNIMLNGNETKDYMISLDFAKHISMQARMVGFTHTVEVLLKFYKENNKLN